MADFDFKAAPPDGSVAVTGYLFGADSQAAADPSIYLISDIKAAFIGLGDINVASGKTLTVSNTLTLTGTDSSSVAFGAGGTVAYTSDKLSAFAATTSAELAGVISDETGTGPLVFANSPTFTDDITLGTQQTTQGAVVLANTAAGAYATTIKSSNSATAAWTLTLPTTAGTNNYVLKTDGSGNTSWVAQSGSPGGNSGQYQYNNAGAFAGIGKILFANTTFYVRANLGTVTMTIASPCVVSLTAHGLSNDDPVVFTTTGALPTGLTAGTVYYVVNKNTDDFQVSATVGGAAINTSGAQSGTHKVATGNDSNDGSAATRAGAWLTIQHACDYMANVDANGYGVTIQVADGTYSPASTGVYCVSIMYRPRNAEYFYILGNPTTPGNVVIDGLDGSPYGFQVGSNYNTGGYATIRIDRLDGFRVIDAYSYVSSFASCSVGISNAEVHNVGIVIEAYDSSAVNMNEVAFSGTSDYAVYAESYARGGFNNVTFAVGSVINYEVFYLYAYNYFFAILNDYTNLTAGTDYYVGPFCFLDTNGTSASIPGAAGTVDSLGKVA